MKAGLSQMDLVKLMYPNLTDRNALESKKQYLSAIERGTRWSKKIDIVKLKQIAKLLSIDININEL